MARLLVCALLSLAFAAAVHAQSALESARKDIQSTYSFDPGSMTFEQQEARAPSLTRLWDRYDKSPEIYRVALRGVLSAEGERELLYCDGGMLLLVKSKAPDDRHLALASIAKCELSEIEYTPYFHAVYDLAREGFDTLDMQLRFLTRPKFCAVVGRRGLSLPQDYSFLFPLMVQEESRYVGRIAERLKVEDDPTALKSLTLALYYAATPQAEAALRAAARPGSPFSAAAREAAAKMVVRIDEARSATMLIPVTYRRIVSGIWTGGEADLRAKRNARMRSLSEETLRDLDLYAPMLYRTFQ